MHTKLLIDAIVRQTTVLIAELATAGGVRAPLAHVANQVFLELTRELESQGLRQKVIADMFGLTLRSYQRKVQRLTESETDTGRSLWEAVLDFVQSRGKVKRAEVLERFHNDYANMVTGILDDLVQTGVIYKRGRGATTEYRIAEIDEDDDLLEDAATAALVWVEVYRNGPLTADEITAAFGLAPDTLEGVLNELLADGRLRRDEGIDGEPETYSSEGFFTQFGDGAGWEAAVFDHYQAVVNAISVKLRQGVTPALPRDIIGGSTWSYDLWEGHPYERLIMEILSNTRALGNRMLDEMNAYNALHPPPENAYRVTFYVGQSVKAPSDALAGLQATFGDGRSADKP